LGLLLGEILIHARDIARAVRRPWQITPRQAVLVFAGLVPVLPGWVNPERAGKLTATFEVRVRGSTPHMWAFVDGRLSVDPDPQPKPDVHIAAQPVAFLLVCYRRLPLWQAIAAGRVIAWGRRPWLAATLVDRLHPP
jgi:hypothetical protein